MITTTTTAGNGGKGEKNTILGFRMGWQSRCEGLTG